MTSQTFATYINEGQNIRCPLTFGTVVCIFVVLLVFLPVSLGMAGAFGEYLFNVWNIQMKQGMGRGIGITLGLCLDILLTLAGISAYTLCSLNGLLQPADKAENSDR